MEALNNALSSPRFNRVLLWFSALVLALGVGLVVNNLAGGSDDKAAYSPERGFKPQLPVKENPLTNAIRTFLATAVVRKDLDKSWDVVAPTMKQGFTFAQWKSGGGRDGLPVIPYPIDNVDTAQYHLFYATDHEILVDVGLSAKNRAQRPRRFRLGMEPFGSGPRRQWLVSYWMPLWTPLLPIN
jgi:hypothetical protein